MTIYEQNKTFYSHPIRLSEDQRKAPLEVIDKFLLDYPLWDVREHLANWLECALISDNDQYADPTQRANIMCFAEKLEELIEAVHLLRAKKKGGK